MSNSTSSETIVPLYFKSSDKAEREKGFPDVAIIFFLPEVLNEGDSFLKNELSALGPNFRSVGELVAQYRVGAAALF